MHFIGEQCHLDGRLLPHPQGRQGGECCKEDDCRQLLSYYHEARMEGLCGEPPRLASGHPQEFSREVQKCDLNFLLQTFKKY